MQARYRNVIIAAVMILLAVAILIAAMLVQDNRTRSERLVLTASDLTEMNAIQNSEPFPSPYHPDRRNGSEAAESSFSMTVDGWFLDVGCLLVLYNSSSLASQTFQGLKLDTNFTEASVGDGCLIWSAYNETFGTPQVIRSSFVATVLEDETITYFVFRAYPPDDSGTISSQIIEAILKAQVDKVQLGV